jgi:hypothetical protein
MKVPAALLTLALAGAAVAQDGGFDLPECANACATKFLQGGIGNCGKDIECICKNDTFLGEIACCLVDGCSEEDQKKAVAAAADICDAVGVKGLPTEVACATASAASTTASGTASGTAPAPTGSGAAATQNPDAQSTTSESTNFGPRPTAAAGLGAIGGIIAAVALL